MLNFHRECRNPAKKHSKALVFFAVSKQIPIVYSADRGRAEVSSFNCYTRYCLHFSFDVKLICILLLLAYEDVTMKFVKPINRKFHTTTCPHRKKANTVKTKTANLFQRDKTDDQHFVFHKRVCITNGHAERWRKTLSQYMTLKTT